MKVSVPGWRGIVAWTLNVLIFVRYWRAVHAYLREIGRLPNIAFPLSYNEKMFWRRVFDRNPIFITYCDKLRSKGVFQARCDGLRLPETLWVGKDPDQMPDVLFRPDVVVKMNAGWSRNWFFHSAPRGHATFAATCRKWLMTPHGIKMGEWAYSEVEPLLFAESVVTEDKASMAELKVHLFSGDVFYTVIYVGEKTLQCRSAIFDGSGRRLSVTNSVVEKDPSRALPADYCVPECYQDAMRAARAIAKDSDYLRVDFMIADGVLYGGEITVYPTAGLMTNSDSSVMDEMGRCWDLRRSWFAQEPQRGWKAIYRGMLRAHIDAHIAATGSAPKMLRAPGKGAQDLVLPKNLDVRDAGP